MIHYELRCGRGHAFDGWFRSSAAFDQQAADGLLDCPVCASADVSRAIMAPRLSRGAKAPKPAGAEALRSAGTEAPRPAGASAPEVLPARGISTVGGAAAGAKPDGVPAVAESARLPPMPDQVRAVLQRIRAEVEQRCDYVGPKFAETARAIHQGDTPPRPIYGETTPDQAEALADDGIAVSRIPWVPRADG